MRSPGRGRRKPGGSAATATVTVTDVPTTGRPGAQASSGWILWSLDGGARRFAVPFFSLFIPSRFWRLFFFSVATETRKLGVGGVGADGYAIRVLTGPRGVALPPGEQSRSRFATLLECLARDGAGELELTPSWDHRGGGTQPPAGEPHPQGSCPRSVRGRAGGRRSELRPVVFPCVIWCTGSVLHGEVPAVLL